MLSMHGFLLFFSILAAGTLYAEEVAIPIVPARPETLIPFLEKFFCDDGPSGIITRSCNNEDLQKKAAAILEKGLSSSEIKANEGVELQKDKVKFNTTPNMTDPTVFKKEVDLNLAILNAMVRVLDIKTTPTTQQTTATDRSAFVDNKKPLLTPEPTSRESSDKTVSNPSSGNVGAVHQGTENFNSNKEGYLEASNPLLLAENQLRNDVDSYKNITAPLSPTIAQTATSQLVNLARKNIEFPFNSVNIAQNRLIASLDNGPESQVISSSIKALLKKDLKGTPDYAKLDNLNTLAKDSYFQNQSGKIFGDKTLKDFNLAVLGANLISLPGSTKGDILAVNKSLNGELDGLIKKFGLSPTETGAGTSISVAASEDWLEAARILSSDMVTSKLPNAEEALETKAAYKELMDLLRDLGNYKSADLIKLVSVPLKHSAKKSYKNLKDTIMRSISRTLKIPELILNEAVLPEHQDLKAKLSALYPKLLSEYNDTSAFLKDVAGLFKETPLQVLWLSLDESSYITTRRAVALLTLNTNIEPLEDLKTPQSSLTRLIANAFAYLEIRKKISYQKDIIQAKEDEERLQKASLIEIKK